MPLKYTGVVGRPALIFLRRLGTSESAPSTVTVTVDAAGAALGATTIPVTALPAAVPKNTVLQFTNAAGDTNVTKVVVTADADASDTSISVEAFEGASGDGIDAALTSTDKAVWDGLYTDYASENLNFSAGEQTTELSAVTHGGSTGVRVTIPEVNAVSPSVERSGLMLNDGPLLTDLMQNAKTPNANWWVKYQLPDENGDPLIEYEGLARVRGVNHPTPVNAYIQLTYTAQFIRDAFTITNVQAV